MSLFRILPAALLAGLALGTPLFAQDHPEEIHVHDAYARSLGKVGASGAVFFMMHNNTPGDVTLVGASADVAQVIELHTHREAADGVMQMVQIEGGIPLPAGEMHELARGGDHVMLMGLTRELKDGDHFDLTLVFEGAEPVVVDVVVDNQRKPGETGGEMHEHGAEMQGHDAHAGHGHAHAAAPDTTGMSDPEAIVAVMMAQFDTPEHPLAVDPVVVEGDHALASWAQDGAGGRALLERRHGQWVIVLCGGPDLRMPAFLASHGVSGADRLSAMFNSAEDGLGAEKVALYSSFQGVVMIDGASH